MSVAKLKHESALKVGAQDGRRLRVVHDREQVNLPAAERAVRDLLLALGRDPSSPHLSDTPARVAQSFSEMLTPREFDLTTFPNDEHYDELLKTMKKTPIEYFRMFYADTVLGGSASALRCGLDFFGADRIVFASDCPFDPEGGPMFIREGIRLSHAASCGVAYPTPATRLAK